MKLRRQQFSTSFLSKKPSVTIQSFARIYKKNTRQYAHAHSERQRCVHTSGNWDSYDIDWHFIASLCILYLSIWRNVCVRVFEKVSSLQYCVLLILAAYSLVTLGFSVWVLLDRLQDFCTCYFRFYLLLIIGLTAESQTERRSILFLNGQHVQS